MILSFFAADFPATDPQAALNGESFMEILHGLPVHLRETAVSVLLDALGEKIIPAMGGRKRAEALFLECLVSEDCIAAVDKGGEHLLGIAGLKSQEMVFVNAGIPHFIKHAGLFRSLWSLPILAMMEHAPESQEVYLDMIAVGPQARGQGVGRALINAVEHKARTMGKSKLTLQVVGTNPGAKKLYEQLGFRTVKVYKTYPLGRLVGWTFKTVDFMVKDL